jgi:indole-3-glycerol phosphate synthase
MILDQIIEAKKKEVARLKEIGPISVFDRIVRELPPTRDFHNACTGSDCAIIAEIKRRSPSKGALCTDFDVPRIARIYEANGAAAISVLTDRDFFGGNATFLAAAKRVCALPVLRKDFIIDPYQVYETRVLGGDALLLIAGLFDEKELGEFVDLARSLGLSALVEVHTGVEAERAVNAGAGIIGINNRDLKTFVTDIRKSIEIAPMIPPGRIVVSESGIGKRGDIELLMAAGIHVFLVGETLMREDDKGAKLMELRGG